MVAGVGGVVCGGVQAGEGRRGAYMCEELKARAKVHRAQGFLHRNLTRCCTNMKILAYKTLVQQH